MLWSETLLHVLFESILTAIPSKSRICLNSWHAIYKQFLFFITFLFHTNWLTDIFQIVHPKRKENGCSTCNQLNGRKNSAVASKQLALEFSFNDDKLAAKNMISPLEYPTKYNMKYKTAFERRKLYLTNHVRSPS